MRRFAIAIFISAFLLFQVQPMIGRYILPWFGGSPAVWSTCLLFFQVLLLLGYGYAHFLAQALSPRRQAMVHGALLLLTFALLPITPGPELKPLTPDAPQAQITWLLTLCVGAPYLLLSSTGPLLQSWFARAHPTSSPYRLYALSNLGSLLGLLTYPFIVEPRLTLGAQTLAWSGGFVLFALATLYASSSLLKGELSETPISAPPPTDPAPAPPPRQGAGPLLWMAFAACPTALLLATTNQLCQEVAVIPFLWVIPLVLYLLSFILTFESDRWYRRGPWALFTAIAFALEAYVMLFGGDSALELQVLAGCLTLFGGCMICHGELASQRPEPARLTGFYLSLSAGGALGGVFVSLIAPRVFRDFWEFPLSILGVIVLLGVALWRDPTSAMHKGAKPLRWAGILAFFFGLSIPLALPKLAFETGTITSTRNFYGLLRVYDDVEKDPHRRVLRHGHITHGFEIQGQTGIPAPTAYYGPGTGIHVMTERHPERLKGEAMNVGVVGLGVGAIASLMIDGDAIRFYEINPAVIDFAKRYFTFLSASPGEVDVVLGDGRIALEESVGHHPPYDILVADAFSSDAIPIHLLTLECFELYWQHLNPDGVLAVHISNMFLDLRPVVLGLAEAMGKSVIQVDTDNNPEVGTLASSWMLVTSNPDILNDPILLERGAGHDLPSLDRRIWTDDFSNLLHVLQ